MRIERLDVTSIDQARSLARKLADVPIDVLINNAGVYNDRSRCRADDEECPGDWSVESFGKLKYSLLDTIMAVNIKGPLIVSEAFYANVKASAQKKIVAISSSNGTLTEHQAYLKSYPGMLATFFTVRRMIETIGKVTIRDSGRFLRYDGATEPW